MSSEKPPVFISSFGCASGIGSDLQETLESLRAGKSGVRPVDLFSTEGCRAKCASTFPESVMQSAAAIHRPARRWPRASKAVLAALAETLQGGLRGPVDAVIVGTTSGGMDLGETFYRKAHSGSSLDSAARRMRAYLPQMPVVDALRVFGIRAPVRVISNACASGSNALGVALQMIHNGSAERVIAGGYDILAQLVFAGFDCLQAASPDLCRPFDSGRSGLVLGEGAAFFVLEKTDGPFRLAGYGAATDTHHLTQPEPGGTGPATSMALALKSAGWDAAQVEHINAHGTGTPQNDACETRAISNVSPLAVVTSTKAMTGHTLGAAGAIEAAFSLLSLKNNFVPPTLNFREPDPDCTLDIAANQSRPLPLRRVLSNSFGFGGANATLAFEKL